VCTEAAMQCVRENIELLDVEAETLDAEVLNSMYVTNDHFKLSSEKQNPSSLRDVNV